MPDNVRTLRIREFGAEVTGAWSNRSRSSGSPSRLACAFLASEEAGYITGQTLVIDGGPVLPEGQVSLERERWQTACQVARADF
jgi:3-oxoacyl-[acyl-carrier protein] reductase